MEYREFAGRSGRRAALRGIVAAALTSLALSAPAAHAQQEKQPAQKQQGQQQQGQQQAAPQNSWVKLCQDQERVKDGAISTTEICLTHHERLSSVNGMVLVSAAVRKIEGIDKETLMVLVPLGVALPPGLQVIVDDNKPIPLRFTFCHVGGCTAETVAKPEIIESLKKGTQLKVLALNNQGKTVAFPVPLEGFTKAYAGPPVDTEQYQQARKELMQLIRKRQIELAKKAKEENGKKEGAAAPAQKKQ